MNRLALLGMAALAAGLVGCGPREGRAPRVALEACRSTKALMAVRRAVFQEAASAGVPTGLLGRLRHEGRASLEDPEVKDYDDDTRVVSCAAQLTLAPPGSSGQTATSRVTYDAEPSRSGSGYRFQVTDIGQMVSAIASLGPLPPEAPPASSTAANAAANTPGASDDIDPEVREDAAAAGDTGRTHRTPAPILPPPQH